MKLLFSLTYYTPYISGLTLYVKRLAEALVKKNYCVTVLTMLFDKKQNVREFVKGVEVVRAKPLIKISKGFISFDWIVKSWQEVKRNDVVVISLPQFEGFIPILFGRLFGKKVITIYHCEVILPFGIFNKMIESLLNLTNVVTLLLSNTVVTYTEDFTRESKLLKSIRFLKKETLIKTVYPPIPVPKVDKRTQKILLDKTNSQRFWTSQNDHYLIGIAARLAAEKGIEYLLEGIPYIESRIKNQESRHSGEPRLNRGDSRIDSGQARMTKVKIIIAGSLKPVGEEKYRKKILSLVEKYKNYIVFLGELKEEEMGSFYSLLDVLVLPSINSTEAFGMVQVEAMMMGVPVVASDLPGVRVPIQKTGMGILVPIKNSQKLAEAIVEVLLNREKYLKNKKLIEKEFSFEKTISFYSRLLNQ